MNVDPTISDKNVGQ